LPERCHPIELRELSPLFGERGIAKISERGSELSCVFFRRLDEDVEILSRARPTVRGQGVRPDDQEADAVGFVIDVIAAHGDLIRGTAK
jgi:hypothetical protein